MVTMDLTRLGLERARASLRGIAALGEEELAGGAGLTRPVRAAHARQRAQVVFALFPPKTFRNVY